MENKQELKKNLGMSSYGDSGRMRHRFRRIL